jgi:hypothetical protein
LDKNGNEIPVAVWDKGKTCFRTRTATRYRCWPIIRDSWFSGQTASRAPRQNWGHCFSIAQRL